MHLQRKTCFTVVVVVLFTAMFSCLTLSGCGRNNNSNNAFIEATSENFTQRLSGEYSNSEEYNMGFDFISDNECIFYWGSRSEPMKCTYYWNSQDNCYHIETEEKVTKVSGDNWETEVRQQYSFDFVMDGELMIITGFSSGGKTDDSFRNAILRKGRYDDTIHKANKAADPIKEKNETIETVSTENNDTDQTTRDTRDPEVINKEIEDALTGSGN